MRQRAAAFLKAGHKPTGEVGGQKWIQRGTGSPTGSLIKDAGRENRHRKLSQLEQRVMEHALIMRTL